VAAAPTHAPARPAWLGRALGLAMGALLLGALGWQLAPRWAELQADIDPARHADVAAYLAVQEAQARWWRDACIAYFQSVSGLPLPAGTRAPAQALDHYKALRFPFAPGRGG